MGQQARQAAAGQGRDRGGEAPRQPDGGVCWSHSTQMLGTPPQVREVMECEGRWLLAGLEACPLPLPIHPDFQSVCWKGPGRILGKVIQICPLVRTNSVLWAPSLAGEDLTRALQLRAFLDAGSACEPGILPSQPQGGLLPDSDLHTKSPHAI